MKKMVAIWAELSLRKAKRKQFDPSVYRYWMIVMAILVALVVIFASVWAIFDRLGFFDVRPFQEVC